MIDGCVDAGFRFSRSGLHEHAEDRFVQAATEDFGLLARPEWSFWLVGHIYSHDSVRAAHHLRAALIVKNELT